MIVSSFESINYFDTSLPILFVEFLLGDDIIAAPIVVENKVERDIYLPKGQWQDGNSNKVYKGPIWIMGYQAPLDTLPYFIRVGAILS